MYTYETMMKKKEKRLISLISSFAGWCGFIEYDWVVIAQQVYQAYVRASTPIEKE